MTDIVERLRVAATHPFNQHGPCEFLTEAADEITRLRAEIERLRKAIKRAIRQHEEGNKGLSHRTLCEAVYGEQA